MNVIDRIAYPASLTLERLATDPDAWTELPCGSCGEPVDLLRSVIRRADFDPDGVRCDDCTRALLPPDVLAMVPAHPTCVRCGGFLVTKDDLIDHICIRCHREVPMAEPPNPHDDWADVLDSPCAPPWYDLDDWDICPERPR